MKRGTGIEKRGLTLYMVIDATGDQTATEHLRLRTLRRGDIVAVAAIPDRFCASPYPHAAPARFRLCRRLGIRPDRREDSGRARLVQPDLGQMTLVSHAYWGALFAWLFGLNFTVLTAANNGAGPGGGSYLLRHTADTRLHARLEFLGTALLVLNPFFVTLSYSFMTEISFVALMLVSSLFYLLGFQHVHPHNGSTAVFIGRSQVGWLWLGGLFAGLAFLDRQFGLALPAAAVLWLFLARRASWTSVMAVVALPVAALVGYYLLVSGSGSTFSDSQSRSELLGLFTGLGG